jgi:hypothetical protein
MPGLEYMCVCIIAIVNLSVHLIHPDSPKWHAIGEIYKDKRCSLLEREPDKTVNFTAAYMGLSLGQFISLLPP